MISQINEPMIQALKELQDFGSLGTRETVNN
jgi:hypothetical protein